MRLTKLEHACVRLEKDGVILAIDPSVWSMPEALVGASAVLVTHEHFDHLAGVGGDQVHIVDHGGPFSVAGFDVHAYGHLHAQLHRDIPIVENTGFLID